MGDNFDAKYCNHVEKVGLETRARYDNYLREEKNKNSFDNFYYYFNEFDIKDSNNTNETKLYNPHLNIQTNNILKEDDLSNNILKNNSSALNITLDNKFSKIKMMSNSGSTSSLMRQYRQLSNVSNNSTSSSTNFNGNINSVPRKRTGSFNY